MTSSGALPAAFAELEPFVADWTGDSEEKRHWKRVRSDLDTAKRFHAAAFPRMHDILTYLGALDGRLDPKALPEPDRNLYYLAANVFEVSHPIDLQWSTTDIDDKFPSGRLIFEDVPGR